MGERHLFLDSTEGLAPGQWVRILQSDANGSLASYLYGTDYQKMSKQLSSDEDCEPTCASDMSNQRDLLRWATRILAIEDGNIVVLQVRLARLARFVPWIVDLLPRCWLVVVFHFLLSRILV
jgi:hypothetical protein